jgi:hypothetical protein
MDKEEPKGTENTDNKGTGTADNQLTTVEGKREDVWKKGI